MHWATQEPIRELEAQAESNVWIELEDMRNVFRKDYVSQEMVDESKAYKKHRLTKQACSELAKQIFTTSKLGLYRREKYDDFVTSFFFAWSHTPLNSIIKYITDAATIRYRSCLTTLMHAGLST